MKLRAIVAVEADQWDRQPLPDVMDGAVHALLTLAPDRVQARSSTQVVAMSKA